MCCHIQGALEGTCVNTLFKGFEDAVIKKCTAESVPYPLVIVSGGQAAWLELCQPGYSLHPTPGRTITGGTIYVGTLSAGHHHIHHGVPECKLLTAVFEILTNLKSSYMLTVKRSTAFRCCVVFLPYLVPRQTDNKLTWFFALFKLSCSLHMNKLASLFSTLPPFYRFIYPVSSGGGEPFPSSSSMVD